MEAESLEPSRLALVLSVVMPVWVLTAAILVVAARHHRATRRVHCQWLRWDVEVASDGWDGRLLDMRRCSGLDPPTDFEFCGERCLDLDVAAPSANASPGTPPEREEMSSGLSR
jgi:hypothetical protein